jgi:hypothetical protein
MNDGYWDGTVILCTESFSKKVRSTDSVAIRHEVLLATSLCFSPLRGEKRRGEERRREQVAELLT